MAFYLQDPGDPDTTYLLEILIQECQSATGGGASFAWATQRGVNLLLENKHFIDLLSEKTFHLVIGIDAVTDEKALQALARVQKELAGLTVSIFLNNYSGSMFHPKVCWFSHGKTGTLITGSGNLTERGLSSNWEAFTVTELNQQDLSSLEDQWSSWKSTYADDLYEPTDAVVVEQAKKNTRPKSKAATGKKIAKKKFPANKKVGKDKETKVTPVSLDVLVAEIPGKTNPRWKQANFDRDNYENFFGAKVFGAKVEKPRFMLFRHVEPDGSLEDTETRSSVVVKSRNFRFELAAAAGLKYPSKGRPIAVFVRQASRNFRYRLVMPGDAGHKTLEKFLSSKWKGRADRMRRVRTTVSDLQGTWKDSPLWKVAESEPSEF